MRTAQLGDRVQVHYLKHAQDGSTVTSRRGPPLEVTVGTDHPRLPGLGQGLVGLSLGGSVTVQVSPDLAQQVGGSRVRRWDRSRFPKDLPLPVDHWVRAVDGQGRRRAVRILEVCGDVVVVDTTPRWTGQTLELQVELVGIQEAYAPAVSASYRQRAITFDVDASSLASFQEALKGWDIETVDRVTLGSLDRDWNPRSADLLVVGARTEVADTLGVCRALRSQAGRALTPLIVLVRPEQWAHVRAALEVGANNCLVLPVREQDVTVGVARARSGNRPCRPLDPDPDEGKDEWQDDGGEG